MCCAQLTIQVWPNPGPSKSNRFAALALSLEELLRYNEDDTKESVFEVCCQLTWPLRCNTVWLRLHVTLSRRRHQGTRLRGVLSAHLGLCCARLLVRRVLRYNKDVTKAFAFMVCCRVK